MKKILIIIFLFSIAFPIKAQFKVPAMKEQSYVQDYENVLTPEQKVRINVEIAQIRKSSSIEMVVVILNDLQGDDIADAALQIGRSWGVGKKDIDNGLVYLLSPKNHKVQIEVGKGLEGDLPDITCHEITDASAPFYHTGNWYEGIQTSLNKIAQQLSPAFKAQKKLNAEREAKQNKSAFMFFLKLLGWVLLIGLFVFLIIRSMHPKKSILNSQEEEEEKEDDDKSENLSSLLVPGIMLQNTLTNNSYHDDDDDDDDSSSNSYSSSSDDDDSNTSFGGFSGGSFSGGGGGSDF